MRQPRTRRFGRGRSIRCGGVPHAHRAVAWTRPRRRGDRRARFHATRCAARRAPTTASRRRVARSTRPRSDGSQSRRKPRSSTRRSPSSSSKVTDAEARTPTRPRSSREPRALEIYKGSGTDLGPVLDERRALDSVRRAELLDRPTPRASRRSTSSNRRPIDLAQKRQELETAPHRRRPRSSSSSGAEQAALEQQLAALQGPGRPRSRRRGPAPQQAAASRAEGERQRAQGRGAESGARKTGRPATPHRRSPSRRRRLRRRAPHHDDPFLACTRARESHGNYGVVSGSGLYYGAYQFSPTTWNIDREPRGPRRSHRRACRSRASAYDQDDMAWTLYQWQGKGPWGGRC